MSTARTRLALLSSDELRTLGARHPALLGETQHQSVSAALVVSGSPAMLSALRALIEHHAREAQQTAAVLAALAPDPANGLIPTAQWAQLRRPREASY